MPCPTCDHTMWSIQYGVFWCPRCGTLNTGDSVSSPLLLKRCRDFERAMRNKFDDDPADMEKWKRLGIAESINKPEDRTT